VDGGRYWRELFVAAPVDGVVVEGFVDLVYESPRGLVVVDYKTDAVASPEEIDAAVARHRLQAAAYAAALGQSLGRPVVAARLVFVGPDPAVERTIADLPAALGELAPLLRAAPSL
jgi:ATP-dependent helicase/nuclease subunit A